MLAKLSQYLQELGLAKDSLNGWECHVAMKDGEDVALVIVRGCEVHMCSLTLRPAISRKNVLEFLTPVFNEYGYVTTRVPVDVTDDRLRDKLGFKYTHEDENFRYFSMTSLPFSKAKP